MHDTDGWTEALALPDSLMWLIKSQKQLTAGKEIEGHRQMLMMGSTDQEIGKLNRENSAITHTPSHKFLVVPLIITFDYCCSCTKERHITVEAVVPLQ